MQRFRTHYLALSVAQRQDLAAAAGTTTGTLNQVVYAGKRIELGLADCLVALCPGLELGDMPLTDRALQQRKVREAPPVAASQGAPTAALAAPAESPAAAHGDRRTVARDPATVLEHADRKDDKPAFAWQRGMPRDKPTASREQGPGRGER